MAEGAVLPRSGGRLAVVAYRFAAMLFLNDVYRSPCFDLYSADIHQNTHILPLLRHLFQQKPATSADFFVLLHA